VLNKNTQTSTVKYLLEKQCKSRGEAVYLISAKTSEEATFNDVYSMANQIGHALKSFSCKKGDTVATMLTTSFEAVYSWFGCSVIGAIEVPINNAYKGNILRYVLNNSEAKILIVEAAFLPRIVELRNELEFIGKIIVVRDKDTVPTNIHLPIITWEDFLKDKSTNPHQEELYDWDVFHMIYTSGTTGPSKGVLCTYKQTYVSTIGTLREDNTTEKDRYYNPFPLNHIGGRSSLYGMLIRGGSVVLRDRFKTSSFWEDVKRFRCTCTLLLGAMANFIYKQPPTFEDAENSLRWLSMIPLIPEVEDFKKRFNVKVQTCYNMTEISSPVLSPGFNLLDNKSCGKARPGFDVRLVNEMDEEVPHGEVGEMVIRSEIPWSLNVGYWKMAEKTVEAWRNLWFHTGDLFYRDQEGNYYYVDRKKDAIRRRGENISSSEVESEVNQFPKVLESAAVAIPSELGEEEIKIVVVEKEVGSLQHEELIHYLVSRMPHFMVPRYVEIVKELPKTETQKIMKAVLRDQGITENTWDREKSGIKVTNDKV
jgi:carnitine-CoA ligase